MPSSPAQSSLSAAAQFFSSPAFAVVGASSDPAKYGYKVLQWYISHSLSTTPINPRGGSIALSSPRQTLPAVTSLSALPASSVAETAVSIITPPTVTKKVLEEAASLGIRKVWMQPGAFDQAGEEYARVEFEVVLAGFEGGTEGDEGWCVLVDGEEALAEARKGEGKGPGGKL